MIPIANAFNKDWEVIVVDDGSTDNTSGISKALIARFGSERIVYSPSSSNHGAQVARNRGFAKSRGEFVVFLDSDDVPVPEGYAALEDFLLANEQFDFAYGKVLITDSRLHPTGKEVGSTFEPRPREIAGYHWHTMGAIYRRAFIERVGQWNEALTGSQDWEFQARAKMLGKGCFQDVVVGCWRQHDGDRVGTGRFRFDYSISAMVAFRSVIKVAKELGLFDNEIGHRFALKWLRVGLEFGANKCYAERASCMDEAIACASESPALMRLLKGIQVAPRPMDKILLHSAEFCANSATVRRVRSIL